MFYLLLIDSLQIIEGDVSPEKLLDQAVHKVAHGNYIDVSIRVKKNDIDKD